MRLAELERRLNRRLRAINRSYRVSHLEETGKGTVCFDLSVEFDPADMPRVKAVFGEILGQVAAGRGRRSRKATTQKKYYLDPSLAARASRVARKANISESELVGMALRRELRRLGS